MDVQAFAWVRYRVRDCTIRCVNRQHTHGHTGSSLHVFVATASRRLGAVIGKLRTKANLAFMACSLAQLATSLRCIQASSQGTAFLGHRRVHHRCELAQALLEFRLLSNRQIVQGLTLGIHGNLSSSNLLLDECVVDAGVGCVVQIESQLCSVVKVLSLSNEVSKVCLHRRVDCFTQGALEGFLQSSNLSRSELVLHQTISRQVGYQLCLAIIQQGVDVAQRCLQISLACCHIFHAGIDRLHEVVGHAVHSRAHRRTKHHGSQRCLDDVAACFGH